MKIKEQNIYTELFFEKPSKVLNLFDDLVRFETNQDDHIEVWDGDIVVSYVIPLEQNSELLSQVFDVRRYLSLCKEEYDSQADGVTAIDLIKVITDLSYHHGVEVKSAKDQDYIIYCDDDDTSVIYNITYQTELAEHIAQQKEQEVPLDTRFTDVMIDIETLDTEPTAVILSIAARAFNIATGEVCQDEFYRTIKIDEQVRQGRTTSIETTLWWGSQAQNVQDEAFKEEENLTNVFHLLRLYVRKYSTPTTLFWARPPRFDFSIIKNALGADLPLWDHTCERDVRTYVWANPKQSPIRLHVPTHIAYQDVDDQIKEVCQVYRSLNELTARE